MHPCQQGPTATTRLCGGLRLDGLYNLGRTRREINEQVLGVIRDLHRYRGFSFPIGDDQQIPQAGRQSNLATGPDAINSRIGTRRVIGTVQGPSQILPQKDRMHRSRLGEPTQVNRNLRSVGGAHQPKRHAPRRNAT